MGGRAWRRLLDPDRRVGAVVLYALAAGVIAFWRLGAVGLVSMEGMVVEGGRRMLASGEWIVPRLYGEIYTYKPALAYWLASLPQRLGESPSEALLRLPFAAAGFLMGLAVLLLVGRQAGWRAGLLGALASVSGVLFLQKGRMMEFDIPLAAGVGVAVAAACVSLAAPRQRWGVWLLGYLALAAGFLAKGIPALAVFGPGLLVAAWAAGRSRRLFGWRHLSAALLFVALVGSYLWAAWERAGAAAFEQPLVEAGARGLGLLAEENLETVPEASHFVRVDEGWPEGWVGRLTQTLAKPLLIWAAFLPWTVLLPFAWRRSGAEPGELDRLGRAAAGFLLAGVVVFMLTPTHETRYYLPLCVPAGILCGLTAERLSRPGGGPVRGAAAAAGAVALVIAAATALMAFRFPSPPVSPASRGLLVAAGAAGLIGGVALLRARARHRLLLLLGIGVACAMLTQYLGVEPYRAGKRTYTAQARQLAPYLSAGETLWVRGPSDRAGKHASLYFYLDRPVRAFRSAAGLPAGGGTCLLVAPGSEPLAPPPGVVFEETARAEHVWWTFHLGRCAAAGPAPDDGRPPFG